MVSDPKACTQIGCSDGLMVRIDERRWLKAGVEFSDGQPMLSTVLTDEKSDWATMPAPPLLEMTFTSPAGWSSPSIRVTMPSTWLAKP